MPLFHRKKKLQPMSRNGTLTLQVLLALLLLVLLPLERAFHPYDAIRAAGDAWAVRLSADPLYPWRALLMGLNLLAALGSATLSLIMLRGWLAGERATGTLLISSALTWFVLSKVCLLAPFWINGVPGALTLAPQPGMDPKALLPATWFPTPVLWQASLMLLVIGLLLSLPLIAGIALWHGWRSGQWKSTLLVQLPLVVALLLLWSARGLGPWLGD